MRVVITSMLVFILSTCPFWCAVVESKLDLHHAHDLQEQRPHDDSAAPHPVNDDDCVCNGALLACVLGPLPGEDGPGPSWFPYLVALVLDGGSIVLDLPPIEGLGSLASRDCARAAPALSLLNTYRC